MHEYIPPGEEYPLWRVARDKVLQVYQEHGYGFQFTHIELKGLMGIRIGENRQEYDKEQCDYMAGFQKLKKDLVENHKIYLSSIRHVGYEIATPSQQVNKCADYYIRKSQRALSNMARVLVNTDTSQLSMEDQELRLNKINRVAFVRGQFKKRIIPAPKNNKKITHEPKEESEEEYGNT